MKTTNIDYMRRMVWSGVGVLLLALTLGTCGLIWSLRANAIANSSAQLERFASGAVEAINGTLLSTDVLLANTDAMLGLSVSQVEWLDTEAASVQLHSAERQYLMVRSLTLFDAKGHQLVSSDPLGAQRQADLPPGFLTDVLAQPISTMVVSAPSTSLAGAERVLYFGRYVRVGNGEKLVVVAQVPHDMLTKVLMQGVDIDALQVTLERGSGQLLLGVASADDYASLQHAVPLAGRNGRGSAQREAGRLNDVPALVVARSLLYRDLWISAGIPLESVLAQWRLERDAIAAAALVFAFLLLVVGTFAVQYIRRLGAAREAINVSKQRLDQALESMVSGLLLMDAQQRIVQWNQRLLDLFPWLAATMRPLLPYRDMLAVVARNYFPDADASVHLQWVAERLVLHGAAGGTHEQTMPDGARIQIVERPTPEGGRVITYQDVSALRRASEEIESLAFYDPLTGLPNRRMLLDRLQQCTAAGARSAQIGGLLFLDLDAFKAINDTLGHEAGDRLLQEVAARLKACVRESDTVARLGGDEFVIMLPELAQRSHQAASLLRHVGDKILQALAQPYLLHGQTLQVTSSLGATLFGPQEQSGAELLRQADIAMYQVKGANGNALCFFDPQMQASIHLRAQLEVDLKRALEEGEFELHYQPQFTLDGRIVGAEALLRWWHPERGMVSPAEFITLAEERELIVPIGLWVLRSACQLLASWARDARLGQLQLSVNVSARQFRHPDFVVQVLQTLRETGAPAARLKLELTESLVLDNVDDCVHKMELLRAAGLQFSLDDFGTGQSSLSYLTRLPLQQLKIDQSFVRNLGQRASDGVIVQTIIGMARNLALEVIAEGVETPQQRDFLAAHGCARFQGYLYARPMPVSVLERLLESALTV